MWVRGPLRNGAIQINRLVSFEKGVKAIFAEPWADVWYVDGVNGSDRNSGRGQNKAKILISAAEAAASDNDVVYLKPGDHTLPAKLTWDLDDARLIGLSPIPHQPHLDLWMATGSGFNPMMEVTGRGNIFANMTLRHGASTGNAGDLTALTVNGRYNYFENIYTYSPMYSQQDVVNTLPSTWTGYLGVKVTEHGNYFRGCHFGGEGLARDQVNFNVYVTGIGTVFEDCSFITMLGSNDPSFVYLDNLVRDLRYVHFKRCSFIAYSPQPGVAGPNYTMTRAIRANANGNTVQVILDDCNFVNVTKVSTDADAVWFWQASPGEAAATNKTGIAIRDVSY